MFEIDKVLVADNGASPEDEEIAKLMGTAILEAAPRGTSAARIALCAVRAAAAIVCVCAQPGKEAELLAASAAFMRQKAERIKPPRAN